MTDRLKTHHAICLLCLLAVASVGRPDVLVTTKGARFEGTITEDGDRYILKNAKGGTMTFPKNVVREIIRKSASTSAPAAEPKTPEPGTAAPKEGAGAGHQGRRVMAMKGGLVILSVDGDYVWIGTGDSKAVLSASEDLSDGAQPEEPMMLGANAQRTGVYATRGVHKLGRIRWRQALYANGASGLVVADGVVCVGVERSRPPGTFHGFDAVTGKKLWTHEFGAKRLASAPVAANGLFYVGNRYDAIHAVAAKTGALVWEAAVRGDVTVAAIAGGVLYVGSPERSVYGLDARTGKLVWEYSTGIDPDKAVIENPFGINYTNEEEKRKFIAKLETRRRTIGGPVISPVAVSGNLAYFSVGGAGGDGLCAVSLETRKRVWQLWHRSSNNVVVAGDLLYAFGGEALDARTGDPRFLQDVSPDARAFDGNMVYLATPWGYVAARDIRTQLDAWCQQYEDLFTGLSVADGMVYLGTTQGKVRAIEAASGIEVWNLDVGSAIQQAPAVHDGVLYFTTKDGFLYAIDEVPGVRRIEPPPQQGEPQKPLPGPDLESLLRAVADSGERLEAAAAAERLAEWGEAAQPAVPHLIRLGDYPESELAAMKALVRIGSQTALGLLTSRGPEDTRSAVRVWAVGEIGGPAAVDWLMETLRDRGNSVPTPGARAAAEALVRIGVPSVEALCATLSDGRCMTWAARGLARIGDPRAVEPLIGALNCESTEVRTAAAIALDRFRDPRAADPLSKALQQLAKSPCPDEKLRAAIEQALKHLRQKSSPTVPPAKPPVPEPGRPPKIVETFPFPGAEDVRSVERLVAKCDLPLNPCSIHLGSVELRVNGAPFRGRTAYDAIRHYILFDLPDGLPAGAECEWVLHPAIRAKNGAPIPATRVRFTTARSDVGKEPKTVAPPEPQRRTPTTDPNLKEGSEAPKIVAPPESQPHTGTTTPAADGMPLPPGPPWKTYLNCWQERGGTLAVSMGDRYVWAWALHPAPEWKDYAIECDFRHDSAGFVFLFRLDEEKGTFYAFTIAHEERSGRYHDPAQASFGRCHFKPENRAETLGLSVDVPLAKSNYELPRGQFRKLRIEVKGNSMRAFVEGKCILKAEDKSPTPFQAGGFGFGASTSCFVPCKAAIRNLKVVGPVASDPSGGDAGKR